jgi:DNA mismatch repair protein MSH6
MDELGRGTSTFDGTAIASATVKHLVERSQCLTLFATHYHSLLDEWKQHPMVRLGHMECMVSDEKDDEESTVTFLYTLGDGVCPKSFGINVARLAGLPEAVLSKAKQISSDFEEEVSSGGIRAKIAPSSATLKQRIDKAMSVNDWKALSALWQELRA